MMVSRFLRFSIERDGSLRIILPLCQASLISGNFSMYGNNILISGVHYRHLPLGKLFSGEIWISVELLMAYNICLAHAGSVFYS